MKFFIFSLVLHMIILYALDFSNNISKEKPKNIVVYLNEVEIEGKGNPNPAPIKNIDKVENETEKIEESKKKENIKEIEKKIKKINKEIKNKNIGNDKSIKKSENKNENNFSGLIKDASGTYIGDQRSSQGIGYKVKIEIDPFYPEMAKKVGLKKEVVIKTKFLVNLDGKVEEIIFLDDFTKYGFHKEVEKALKKWEFEPIIYQGKNIKMYFYKDFRFNVK